jgi:hydroxypyruvate isomerase
MPQFAANLTMLFTESLFMERFGLAKDAGFKHVEYLLPYAFKAQDLQAELNKHGLKQVLFNLPCGDWAGGDRGIAIQPDRVSEFRAGVGQAIEYARVLGVTRLNCLAGKRAAKYSDQEQWSVLVENVRFAAEQLQAHGCQLVVEAVNHFDLPGFYLNRTSQVLKLIEEVGRPNVQIQYDLYHAQREEGELTATLRRLLPQIGHIQIADNPGRHEPGTGEINYPFLLKEIDALGYQGYIGLEYIPGAGSQSSFGWIRDFGYQL